LPVRVTTKQNSLSRGSLIHTKLNKSICIILHVTCISGSIPVLYANTRLADAPIVVNILPVDVPGIL